MQIHDRCRIRDLTPTQITSLTAFLSSPATAPDAPHFRLASKSFIPPPPTKPPLPFPTRRLAQSPSSTLSEKAGQGIKDPLKNLKIESDLRREVRENIAHQRMIGSYVGRRHAMGLPVRGQNTQTNAKNARRLNRVERYS